MAPNRARERYLAKVQQNKIVAQLNQLRGAGFSTDQIRAAGNDAWTELGGGAPKQVTVADGDTLSTIAASAGVDPANILDANPELKQVRTGMVVNVPNQDARGRGYGGLPSNAALGGTTTNPFGRVTGSSGGTRTVDNFGPTTLNTGLPRNNFASSPSGNFSGGGSLYVPPGLSQQQRAAIPGILQSRGMNVAPARTAQPLQPAQTPNMFASAASQARAIKNDFLPLEYLSLSQSPAYTPSPAQTSYLERMGYLVKDTQTTGGYGSYVGRRGRRGGGGGGGGSGGVARATGGNTGVTRAPAFSSGVGFKGLINWRI